MSTEIILSPAPELQPAPLFTPTPKAAKRVLEFFTTQINNDHTRKATHRRPRVTARTTKLYDRRQDEISLDEVERISNLMAGNLVMRRRETKFLV